MARKGSSAMTSPRELWGDSFTISNCIVGVNLNQLILRGFATLEFLADISSADVYDQQLNPLGTQRPLAPSHAKEASDYAVNSIQVDPVADPRAFTEIILNVRDLNSISIVIDGRKIDPADLHLERGETQIANLEVKLSNLNFPQDDYNPQISRVDGNHRLSGVKQSQDRDLDFEGPTVSFALFIGLEKDQERKIFADINGNQAKINTSHLRQIVLRQKGDKTLYDKKTRPQWFARELSKPGAVFEDMVYMGGSKKGIRKFLGTNPPLTFTGLSTMASHTLAGVAPLLAEVSFEANCSLAATGDTQAMDSVMSVSESVRNMMHQYWTAIREVFPEAWHDIKKSEHYLYESAGGVALSKLGADVINALVSSKTVEQTHFTQAVERIKRAGIDLRKVNYKGAAGMAGASRIYDDLARARADGESGILSVMSQLITQDKSKLDE